MQLHGNIPWGGTQVLAGLVSSTKRVLLLRTPWPALPQQKNWQKLSFGEFTTMEKHGQLLLIERIGQSQKFLQSRI